MVTKILFCAVAMSFGWAFRGTISGGTRGAMVAGAIMGLAIATVSGEATSPTACTLFAAAGAIGFSFGGMMTYGQTLGLTHDGDPPPNYWWGILGTAVKGSVWIGLGALLLAMLVGPMRHMPLEWVVLVVGGCLLWRLGVQVLNRPMLPPRMLPRIYFSARDATGRAETWGGLWFAFLGLLIYAMCRQNRFAVQMAIFGLVGGLGFPIGQMLQAWGRKRQPLDPRFTDWWKAMEFTFGAIAGGVTGAGWLWLQRALPATVQERWSIELSNPPPQPAWLTATALVWLAVILLGLEPRWSLWQRFGTLLRLVLPIPFLASRNPVWAALLAGPVVVWVVGATMPQKTFSGQARSLRMGQIANAAVWGAVIWAIVWSLTGRVTGNWLWGMYIIYHWLLLLIHFLGRCGRATRQRAPGLWRHNDLGPVFLTFTIEAALLTLCIL